LPRIRSRNEVDAAVDEGKDPVIRKQNRRTPPFSGMPSSTAGVERRMTTRRPVRIGPITRAPLRAEKYPQGAVRGQSRTPPTRRFWGGSISVPEVTADDLYVRLRGTVVRNTEGEDSSIACHQPVPPGGPVVSHAHNWCV
jgi:hypothetical protein